MDRLYIPQVENPKPYHDFGSPGTLADDAFWRLIDLFPGRNSCRRDASLGGVGLPSALTSGGDPLLPPELVQLPLTAHAWSNVAYT